MGAPDSPSEQAAFPEPPRWRIAFLSFVILALELALVRQIPAEVPVVSPLANLVLTASLLGLGLGCILQERRALPWLLPGGLALALVFILVARRLGHTPPPPLLSTALVAFICSALPFVPLGQALARAMDRHPRLVAVGWAIAGSLVATVLFALTALLGLPPWAGIAGIMTLAAFGLARTRGERAALLAVGLAFLLLARSPLPSRWSPYGLVQQRPTPSGVSVLVNSSFHQLTVDSTTRDETALRAQAPVLALRREPYQVYREVHGRGPESVLVLGAGTGNEVAVALDEGVTRVVAVEIDPVILEIGRELNASAPYADPRVQVVRDDARHALRSLAEPFDLVVFGTLDSRVQLSGHGHLRLENYVYTREAFEEVREHLAEGGLLAVHCPVHRDWLRPRLYDTVRSVFVDRTRLSLGSESAPSDTTLIASRDVDVLPNEAGTAALPGAGRASTDDWPYLHAEPPALSRLHQWLLGTGAAIVLGVFLLLYRLHPVTGLHANYLLLGMGFSLMTSSAVVRLALLYGSTWLVSAVVLSSVLLTVFVANALVLRGRAPALSIAWAGVLAALLVNSVLPVSSLLAIGQVGRAMGAGLLVGVPVFCATLCVSHLLGREPGTGPPLGAILVGAMAGGFLEYVSMATGWRAIWLVVLAIYGLAWLSTRLARRAPA